MVVIGGTGGRVVSGPKSVGRAVQARHEDDHDIGPQRRVHAFIIPGGLADEKAGCNCTRSPRLWRTQPSQALAGKHLLSLPPGRPDPVLRAELWDSMRWVLNVQAPHLGIDPAPFGVVLRRTGQRSKLLLELEELMVDRAQHYTSVLLP
jgi:hypothetical protein